MPAQPLKNHLLEKNFPVRSLVLPGARASGYVFLSRSQEVKAIDVHLVGDDFSQNFTFFAPNPNSTRGLAIMEKLDTMYSAAELHNLESDTDLRSALEQLPCCVSTENNGPSAEPLNVVIIGAVDDWSTAFIRRGYHYQSLTSRNAFGRSQDVSGKKLSRGYIKRQAQTIRIWQTPIRYRGKPVFIGQCGNRRGGRFAKKAPSDVTAPLDPLVDDARNDLTQDLVYSQALTKIGYVKGQDGLSKSGSNRPRNSLVKPTGCGRCWSLAIARPPWPQSISSTGRDSPTIAEGLQNGPLGKA